MADEMDYMAQAKELADSYRLLVRRRDMLRQQYEDSRSWFYTKDEIIYKLSQGAHEESEHVQTSGTSNPVERTVLNCDKVLASMNREVQTQRTEQFLEPYYEVCEQIELFEIGLRSLRGQTRLVAEQLFVGDHRGRGKTANPSKRSPGKRKCFAGNCGCDSLEKGGSIICRQKKLWRRKLLQQWRSVKSTIVSRPMEKRQRRYGSIIWIWLRMPNIQKKPKCMRNMQTKLWLDSRLRLNG